MAEQPPHIYTRHRNQLLQEQHNQGFTMLLVEVLSSISSTFCMTTLFQTIPSSEILIVFCSHSLFYSVFREKGLVQRPRGAILVWEICFSPWKSAKMDWKRPKRMTSHALAPFYLSGVQFGALLRPWKTHFQGWSLKKMQKVRGSQSHGSWRPIESRKKTKYSILANLSELVRQSKNVSVKIGSIGPKH